MASPVLSGNDAKTVFQDTLMGGLTGGIFGGFTGGVSFGLGQATSLGEFGRTVLGGVITGGGVRGLTSSIAAGDDAKTTAWNTLKGIAGDRVYAKDIESGKQEAKEVLQTFEREVDVLVHLWIGGEEIVTTQTHPFYVEGKGWTDAGELTEEDCVLDSKNENFRVEGIRIEELREPVKVHNFEVEEYHTYYVGAAEVLVHNDECGRGSGEFKQGKDIIFGSKTKSAEKLANQLSKRGWTKDLVTDTVDNPHTIRTSINRATGNPATVYYTKQGSYVIVDDLTKAVVQVGDNINPSTWVPDSSIVDSYIPK